MKKTAIVLSILALSSCSKTNIDEETKVGDYVCNCTYISALGDPEKKESTDLKNRAEGAARVDCQKLDGKYTVSGYSGTCVIQ